MYLVQIVVVADGAGETALADPEQSDRSGVDAGRRVLVSDQDLREVRHGHLLNLLVVRENTRLDQFFRSQGQTLLYTGLLKEFW